MYALRVRLFWMKMISGNHFHPFPHVWLSQKMIFSGKWLPVDQYFHLWPEMIFAPHFHFKAFPEKERERGRARACERGEETEQSVDLQAALISSPSSRRRDLAKIARSRRRELVPQIAIDTRRREIAISDRSRDRAVASSRHWLRDRDLRSRSLMIFFLGLCFPSFPNTKKYFPENFLKGNKTQRNIFRFQKLAFPKNMYFPENVLRQPNTALEHILLNHFRKILSRIEKVVKIFNNFFNFWLKKVLK